MTFKFIPLAICLSTLLPAGAQTSTQAQARADFVHQQQGQFDGLGIRCAPQTHFCGRIKVSDDNNGALVFESDPYADVGVRTGIENSLEAQVLNDKLRSYYCGIGWREVDLKYSSGARKRRSAQLPRRTLTNLEAVQITRNRPYRFFNCSGKTA
jgi:hypothetical protein